MAPSARRRRPCGSLLGVVVLGIFVSAGLDLLDRDVRHLTHAALLPASLRPNPCSRDRVPTPSYHRDVAASRTIAHLDMDAFYASVELRRRPELKGKPVVVCGSGPRAVVTTASYEARKLAGIHSAMPAAVARRRLPDAIYVRPDFPAYREASARVMEVLRRNAETVEVVGLDEAYID